MGRLNIQLVYENKQSFEQSLDIFFDNFWRGLEEKAGKNQGRTALGIPKTLLIQFIDSFRKLIECLIKLLVPFIIWRHKTELSQHFLSFCLKL